MPNKNAVEEPIIIRFQSIGRSELMDLSAVKTPALIITGIASKNENSADCFRE